MPDRDVVLAKVATIRKCLDRILDVTGLDPEKLEDINRKYKPTVRSSFIILHPHPRSCETARPRVPSTCRAADLVRTASFQSTPSGDMKRRRRHFKSLVDL